MEEETTMEHYRQVLTALREPNSGLRHAVPQAWSGFLALHDGAMADGAVPARLKEGVALAMSVVKRCDGCIAYHAKAAASAGATPDEVAEPLGVALFMDGGTASVYAPRLGSVLGVRGGGRARGLGGCVMVSVVGWLEALGRSDPLRAGGKGANLGELVLEAAGAKGR
jgi:AhpD family alkylhydroperoxidase